MTRSPLAASVLPVALPLLLAGCAHAPAADGGIEGRVVSIDTAPWAYDGSGTLVVVDAGGRTVRVALPARWNLCKGRGLDTAGDLRPGDRVRVTGRAGADGTVDACTDPSGSIERL